MVGQGILDEVILHEMGHILGIGTIWPYVGLRVGDASYYGFTGANALAEYKAISGNLPRRHRCPSIRAASAAVQAPIGPRVFSRTSWSTPTTGPGNIMPISRMTIPRWRTLVMRSIWRPRMPVFVSGRWRHSELDDFADSFLDRTRIFGLVNVGGTSMGTVEAAGDRDWFTVQLTAGANYAIHLTNVTGSLNPYLRLYGSTGVLIAENNDVVPGVNSSSRLTFRPTASGKYYIEASAFGDNSTGTYFLTANSIVNHAPTVSLPSGANVTASAPGQSIAFASLFAGSDADSDPLTYYSMTARRRPTAAIGWSRHQCRGRNHLQVSAAQLAQTSFVAERPARRTTSTSRTSTVRLFRLERPRQCQCPGRANSGADDQPALRSQCDGVRSPGSGSRSPRCSAAATPR